MKDLRYKWINYVLALVIILPILVLVIWAFTARWPWPDLVPSNFTLRGIRELWRQNKDFTAIIGSSIGLSLVVAFLSVLIGLMTSRAYVMARKRQARGLIFAMVGLPYLVPGLVFAMGIHQVMIKNGLANSFWGLVLAHLIYSLPYATYLILDAYESFAFKYEEEAMVLGAGPIKAFFLTSLPLLLPVLSTGFAMAYVVSFSQYFISLLLGGGQVRTFAIVMYPYLQNNNRTIASNYGLVFLLTTMVIFFIFDRVAKHFRNKYQTSSYY